MSEALALFAPATTPWHLRRMLALDTETTSADPETARIVTACTARVGGGLATEARTWLVRPDVPIPPEATAIHGIPDHAAQINGQDQSRALVEIAFDLSRAWAEGLPVVAMNAPFDLTTLDRGLRRFGLDGLRIGGPVIDPKVLDKAADALVGFHRKGSRKLDALCAHYSAKLDGAHDATFDAIAAARVAYRIGQRFPQLAAITLDQLQVAQARWYREQAEGLQEYWRKKGDPRRVDSFEWPMREGRAAE